MKNLLVLALCLFAVTVVPCAANGALISVALMEGYNDGPDVLQDASRGFTLDLNENGSLDATDIGFGVARIDSINAGKLDASGAAQGFVYVVYAAQLQATVAGKTTHEAVDATDNAAKKNPNANWTLSNILGTTVDSDSLAVVIEWDGTGANPLDTAAYDWGSTTQVLSPSQVVTDLQDLITRSTIVFEVGIDPAHDPPGDRFVLQNVGVDIVSGDLEQSLSAQMSITDPGVLDPAAIGTVTTTVGTYDSVVSNGVQFVDLDGAGSLNFLTDDDAGLSIDDLDFVRTRDAGSYLVNYTPEPSSLAALFGLAICGLGLYSRRKKRG